MTPDRSEACRRLFCAAARHIAQLHDSPDINGIARRLAKIQILTLVALSRPGAFASGQAERLATLMEICRCEKERHGVRDADIDVCIASLRPDLADQARAAGRTGYPAAPAFF